MTEEQLQSTLTELLKLPKENEWFELKSAKNDFNLDKLGQYNSALSNEANLRGKDFGWLILGIDNNKNIVGTAYKQGGGLHELKNEIQQKSNLALREIHETQRDGERVLMFQIIPAQAGQPTSWNGHCYGREGESLVALSPEKRNRILKQIEINFDWSAQVCEGAMIDDLDLEALEMAKTGYINKHFKDKPEEAEQIRKFSTLRLLEDFLMLTEDRRLTNTAMLILGKRKRADLLLKVGFATEIAYQNSDDPTDDYDFFLPFQKSITDLVAKIRNKPIQLSYKFFGEEYSPNDSNGLVNYKKETIRECIANCVAHQDYSKRERICVYESINNHIQFVNAGACIYSKEEFELIRLRKQKPARYRNEFLARAMREIGLMEAKGSGHNSIYKYNTTKVFLPLPDIDWKNKDQFDMTVYGAMKDENFGIILNKKTDLEPEQILLLDQVQKNHKLTTTQFNLLKKQGLVSGKPTDCRLDLSIAKVICGAEAVSKEQKKEDFDQEKCIEKIYNFVKKCNKEQILVKTIDIFEHIKYELVIKDTDKKNFNYLNNYIIKDMKKHNIYKIKSSKDGKNSTWLIV